MVWAGISLRCHADLHVFHGGNLTVVRYGDKTLDPCVQLYAAASGNDFIPMDDNGRSSVLSSVNKKKELLPTIAR